MYLPKDPIKNGQLRLDLIANRQEAISGNIANMDTPNYVRRDIEFSQYLNTMNSPLETELSHKLGPSGVIESKEQTMSTEDELANAQKNAIYYNVAVKQLSLVFKQMKGALNLQG